MELLPQNIQTIVKNAEKESNGQYGTFLCILTQTILQENSIFRLLETTQQIREDIAKYQAPTKKKPTLLSSFKDKQTSSSCYAKIQPTLFTQKHLLGCPGIDEHVVLLTCLKELQKEGISDTYTTVLKEMLKKQLHKMENCCIHKEIMGRKKEIEEITRILKRSFRNNVLLIGDSGVGKTTLASASQQYIKDRKMYQLFSGNEMFFDQVVDILAASEDNNILFFLDEIVTFDPAHIKYLTDTAHIIATAHESAYKKFALEHPHIISKFEVLKLEEPPLQETEIILNNHQLHLETHHDIRYEKDFVTHLIQLAKQYMHEPAFPSKGIALLEETLLSAQAQEKKVITTDLLRTIVSQKTNIPLESLSDMDKKDLSLLPDKLQAKVKGQDEAVAKVAQTIQRSRLGFGKKNRPLGSFLFVGPSGVGKTELAKAVAEVLFGDAESMVRLDMSEFSEAHMVQRLIGSPPGYIGYEEGGQLTNPIKQKPYTLVLLDEIEKGHPRVFDIFLQVLDDGRLTDGQGKKVDFTNTVVIATSNAGIEEMLDMVNDGATHDEMSKEIKDILSDYFRIEFINRFDGIVIFNALKPKALKDIAKLQVEKLTAELAKRHIGFSLSDQALDTLAKEAYDPRYGARGLLRLIQERIENKLAEMIIARELTEGQHVEF